MTVPADGPARPGQDHPAPKPGGPGPGAPKPGGRGAGSRSPLERSRLTSRTAVLAVVLCAVALSIAYPVREFIAQRRQLDQLEAQRQAIALRLGVLERQQQLLAGNGYVEQQARDKLHMCLPSETCYVIIDPQQPQGRAAAALPGTPWYERLWNSVQRADKAPAR